MFDLFCGLLAYQFSVMFALQPTLSSRLTELGAERKEEAFSEARASLAPVIAAVDDNLNTQDALLQRVKVFVAYCVWFH